MPATESAGREDQDVVILLLRITAAPALSFGGDVGGIKAIKAILAETLAINGNWILTKALISSICWL